MYKGESVQESDCAYDCEVVARVCKCDHCASSCALTATVKLTVRTACQTGHKQVNSADTHVLAHKIARLKVQQATLSTSDAFSLEPAGTSTSRTTLADSFDHLS